MIEKFRKLNINAPAVLLFMALLAQAPHAMAVFIRIAPHDAQFAQGVSFIGGLVYAIALEGATAFFVWRSKLRWAIAFAGFSIAHNVAYYMPPEWTFVLFGATLLWRNVVGSVLISVSLPIAIAAFSHVQAQHAPAMADATPKNAAEKPAKVNGAAAAIETPVARPDAILGHPGDATTPAQPEKTDVLPATPPAVSLHAIAQRSDGEIAALLGGNVSRQSVQGWRKRGTLDANIVRRLPEVATPHVNGASHD